MSSKSGFNRPLWVVIPAAGVGTRMQSCVPKQYLKIAGKTILQHSLAVFDGYPGVQEIVVAVSEEDQYFDKLPLQTIKKLRRVAGGEERVNSVLNALNSISDKANDDDWVLVHDAARPCLQRTDLDRLVEEVTQWVERTPDCCGGLLGYAAKDTLKQIEADEKSVTLVSRTIDRNLMWHALTPQMFAYAALKEALSSGLAQSINITDEASAMEAQGCKPLLVSGRSDNIKVTAHEDLAIAEAILKTLWQTNSK